MGKEVSGCERKRNTVRAGSQERELELTTHEEAGQDWGWLVSNKLAFEVRGCGLKPTFELTLPIIQAQWREPVISALGREGLGWRHVGP